MKKEDILALSKSLRLRVLKLTSDARSSHVGSAFSMVELLSVLYSGFLNVSPETMDSPERDRFILSKGHAVSVLYALLCEKGFISEQQLATFYMDGTALAGHATKGVPGVELSTGALGHGLSVGCGMAYASKIDGLSSRVWVMLSDGECDEGSIWEAAMFAGHHQLENLVAIVDYNKIQSIGSVSEVLELEPFADKWRAFRWNVIEVDGHNIKRNSASV